jgi:hypothetical protein
MIRHLLLAISGRLPCRIISDGDQPYLERYYLCTVFGVRFYLHRFVGSDPDRGLHDHPWPWAFSIILAGWYWEQTRNKESLRRVRWFNFLTGDSFHRVILPSSQPLSCMAESDMQCWTLFAHRARDVKKWGFLRDKGQLGMVFQPYRYPGGKNKEWWKTAPKGREIRS